jgi:hypothetical protein
VCKLSPSRSLHRQSFDRFNHPVLTIPDMTFRPVAPSSAPSNVTQSSAAPSTNVTLVTTTDNSTHHSSTKSEDRSMTISANSTNTVLPSGNSTASGAPPVATGGINSTATLTAGSGNNTSSATATNPSPTSTTGAAVANFGVSNAVVAMVVAPLVFYYGF